MLLTRPECEWRYYWDAFAELISERAPAFAGVSAIPYSAIRDFARDDNLTPHETNVLYYVVRVLDNRQREIAAERAEKQAKRAGK